jgi:hypothetical protein
MELILSRSVADDVSAFATGLSLVSVFPRRLICAAVEGPPVYVEVDELLFVRALPLGGGGGGAGERCWEGRSLYIWFVCSVFFLVCDV